MRNEIDEGPSSADIERFDRVEAYCPDCGAEIWDQADVCPKCYAYLGGETSRHKPVDLWLRQRWTMFVVIILLLAMLIWLL